MRPLPDQFAHIIKDGLRGARYVLRHGVRAGQEAIAFAPGAPDFARLTDTVLSATERTASRVLQRTRLDFSFSGTVVDAYAAMLAETNPAERKRLFVRLHYRLIEAVLGRLGVENQFISEHEIALGYEALKRRHRRILGELKPSREVRVADAVRFWVAAAVTLGARHPLREIDLPRRVGPGTPYLKEAPTPYCLLIAALTGAILMVRHPDAASSGQAEPGDLDEYVDSAAAVVTARFDRLRTMFFEPKAVELLSREFEAVLPFLP